MREVTTGPVQQRYADEFGRGMLNASANASGGKSLVTARKICVHLGRQEVLQSVDMEVHAGEIVTLVGLNGAGKSTLVRTLLGIVQPDSGTVEWAPGLRIGYSPQRVRRDSILPITVRRFLSLGESGSAQRIAEVLAEVGASRTLDHPMAEISGGEMNRVLLAKALLRKPELLVLDEPLSGVDIVSQSELYRLISNIRNRYGCGILLVSHDLHIVMTETDRVVCLNRHVCCSGPPRAIARDPAFASLFGPHVSEWMAVYPHAHDHRHDCVDEPGLLHDRESAG